MRRALMTAFAAAATIAIASPASAQSATVNGTTLSSGGSTAINFDGPAGSGATSTLQLTYEGVSGSGYLFNYVFTDTAPAISNLTGFGFDTTPTLTGISSTSTSSPNNLVFSYGSQNLAGTIVDACGYAGNNCDAANGQADLFSGSFTLMFGSTSGNIALNDFVDRYASLTNLDGISGEGHPVGGVPEPATWAMMLLGFGGIGMAMRGSRRGKPALMQIA